MNRVWIAIACCLTVTSMAGRAAAACGDFRIDMGEACDDGNVASGDGCSSMCAVESGFVCENISFQLSTVQDLGAGGVTPNWVLDVDNRGVLETTNSHAGVYSTIIPADIGEIVFDVRVEQTGDNDFIGWTIGYDMGEISTTSTPVGTDFLLFSWKQGQQNSGGNRHSGLGLSRVTGPGTAGQYWVGNGGGLTMIAESTNYPIDDSLANNGETVNGWDDNRWYRVNMIVTSTRVQVWIREGNTTNTTNPANRGFPALNRTTHLEFDVTTAIPTGNFGLYAYSQPNVRFDLVNPESDSDCARDYDADGIRDSRDLDSDRDGVLDLLEMPGFTSDPDNDTDLDGIPDWRDPNNIPGGCTASMGVCTTLPAAFDVDGDGIPNHLDRDSDGDGLPDTTEVGLTDVNRDGTPDACTMVTTVGVCVAGGLGNAVPVDTDGRGGANFLDRDSDSDGIPDSVEAGLTDANRDGVPDACTMVTSFGLCVSGGLVMGATLPNTDGVGLPDYADRDADGDGLTDAREAGLTDANGDGIPDTCVSDTAAGLCVAGGLVGALPNTNSAGPVDYVDSDSDGDGITDRNEAYDTNGNQMANIVPTGVDTDADGIDNAYDPSCVLMVCGMTIGAPVLGVLTVAQDANQDGRPDWLTVCGDAYVTGSEPCDDGNLVNNDTCTNMCLVTLTNPCTGNAQCDSGTCNAGTMTCSTCVNNSPTGTDTGCTAATPACIFTGLNSMCVQCDVNAQCPGGVCSPTNLCEVCIDSGAGTDTGCSAATPNCIGASGSRMCVQCTSAAQCNDNVACTTDACTANACVNTPVASGGAGGCAGGQVCSGAPTNTCVTCTDTSPTGTDAGCMNAAPHCRTSGNGAPVCEPCLDTIMGSGMDLGCGAATPYCVAGSGGNSCVACLTGADCGDGNTCTQDVCTAGVCSNPPVSVGTSCAGGVCNGTTPAICEVCVDDGSATDTGCSAATPHCIGASGMRQCVECTTAGHCDDSVDCTDDACTANACVNTSVTAGDPGACASTLVCSGAPSDTCDTCADTDPTETMTDAGCMAAAPFCDRVGGGSGPTCEVCVDAGAGMDPGCASATPNCVVGAGGANECVSCVTNAECNDGNECTDNLCTNGMCTNPALSEFTSCAGGVCTAASMCAAVTVDIANPVNGTTTANNMPTLSGTGTPGGTVELTLDTNFVVTVPVDASGNWSLALTSPLADGPHALVAVITAGTQDAMDSVDFSIDTATVVTIESPADGSTSLDSSPLIQGTGEPGANVVVSVDGNELGTVVVAGDGTWSITVPDPLINGNHTIDAVATDTLGNTASTSSTFTIAADTDVDIDGPADGAVIGDNTPTITGTALPGASVTVTTSIGGSVVTLGTVVADGSGVWTLDVTNPLDDATYIVTATATDLAGNMAQDSSTFTVDTQTTVTIVTVDPMTGVITGTGEPGATVVVLVDGVEVGTAVVGVDGTWQVDGDAFGVGEHDVTATATDTVGNTDTDTTTVTVTAPDGGMIDAGVTPDGGTATATGGLSGGALCATSAPAGSSWPAAAGMLLVAGLLTLRRRRR